MLLAMLGKTAALALCRVLSRSNSQMVCFGFMVGWLGYAFKVT
jgi:hypothetical protein